MGLLRKAENEMAYAKVGLLGFAGSGKTYTASQIAIGLHGFVKSRKPVAFLDTETGSDFMVSAFQRAGIELLVAKSRAFPDLMSIFDEAESACDVLIIDSVTHFWQELIRGFMAKKHITRMEFQHWAPVKEEWMKFSSRFVGVKLHTIVCGRAGYEYDYQENEEGKKDLIKTGVKMKAEGEFGYEPSLVIEMERVTASTDSSKTQKRGKGGAGMERQFVNRAWVTKDRTDTIDGQYFDNPTFETFLPHFEKINIGGEHRAIDTTSSTAQQLFNDEGRGNWEQERRKRATFIEEINGKLTQFYPGQTAIEKQARLNALEDVFGTMSETALADLKSNVLGDGFKRLCGYLKLTSMCKERETTLKAACEAGGFVYAEVIASVEGLQEFMSYLTNPPIPDTTDPFTEDGQDTITVTVGADQTALPVTME